VPASFGGTSVRARGRQYADQGPRARGGGDESAVRRRGSDRQVSPRSLLSLAGGRNPGAPLARTALGYSGISRTFLGAIRSRDRAKDQRFHSGSHAEVDRIPLAGKHPRI